jgi:TolA-binding protein
MIFTPPAWATTRVILKNIQIKDVSKFIRIRFLFKKNFPDKLGSYQHGKALTLLFRGTHNGLSKNVIEINSNIVKDIHILRYKRGMRVVLNLTDPNVEFVRYQRHSPPQVVVSLRRLKTHEAPSPKITKGSKPPGKTHPKVRKPEKPKSPTNKKGTEKVTRIKKKPEKKVEKGPAPKEAPVKKPAPQKVARLTTEFKKPGTIAHKQLPPPPSSPEKKEKKIAFVFFHSSFPPVKDPSQSGLFSKAKKAFKKGDLNAAAEGFRKVMKAAPKTREGEISAFYWARSLKLSRGKGMKEAIRVSRDYEEILREYPDAPWTYEALNDLLSLYVSMNAYKKATKACNKILKKYSDTDRAEKALFQMGKFQILEGAYGKAETTFQTYLKKYPKGKYVRDATFLLGDALYYHGDIQEAVETYQSALKRWPQSNPTGIKTLTNMAMVFAKSGQTDRALDLLFGALNTSATEKERATLLLNIASLYEREKKIREALIIYSKIKAQYPNTQEAALSLKELSRLSRKYPKAKSKGF